MRRSARIAGKSLVWTLVAAALAVAFTIGVLHLGTSFARWTGSPVVRVFSLPGSAMLGMAGWTLVLAVLWRFRRSYLQQNGKTLSAHVIESDLRRIHRREATLTNWRVRIKTQFLHPDSGEDIEVRKEYYYLSKTKAQELLKKFSPGATVPLRVHKNSVLIDIAKRPSWGDLW